MVKSAPSLPKQKTVSPKVALAPGSKAAVLPHVPVMIGTHFHALDEKGRVIIPSKLRPALTEQFWMMLDESNNIAIYNYQTGLDVFEHCERMMAEHPGDEAVAAAVERITSAADLLTVEGNWRVPIPEMLRYYADLNKEVVTVGVLNHAVLWDRQRWEAAQASQPEESKVRKAQASILRAAASGVRVRNERTEQESRQQTSAQIGEVASASDGGGSSERSRLSQLGR